MRRGFFFWGLVASLFAMPALAAPQTTSTPGPKIPESPFRCERVYRYDGQILPCDSHLHRDGEKLREIMKDTPSALESLDRYQSNRSKVNFAAYTGTAGIALLATNGLLAGLFVGKGTEAEKSRNKNKASDVIRWSGIGITVGSVLFGLSALRSNESNLTNAVVRYNDAHPGKPIELLFQHDF